MPDDTSIFASANAESPADAPKIYQNARKIGVPYQMAKEDPNQAARLAHAQEVQNILSHRSTFGRNVDMGKVAQLLHQTGEGGDITRWLLSQPEHADLLGPEDIRHLQGASGHWMAMKQAWKTGGDNAEMASLSMKQIRHVMEPNSMPDLDAKDAARLEELKAIPRFPYGKGFMRGALSSTAESLPLMGQGLKEGVVGGIALGAAHAAVGSVVPGLGTAAGATEGFTIGMGAGMFHGTQVMEAGLAYQEYLDAIRKKQGREPTKEEKLQAANAAFNVGAGNAAMELIPMGMVAHNMPGVRQGVRALVGAATGRTAATGLGINVAKVAGGTLAVAGAEGITETLQEANTIRGHNAIDSAEAVGEEEKWSRLKESAVAGFGMGLVMNMPSAGLHIMHSANTAVKSAVAIKDITEQIEKAPLIKSVPEKVAEGMKAGGMTDNISIDAEVFVTSLKQSGFDQEKIEAAIPGLSKKIQDALETGGDVTLSAADAIAHFGTQDPAMKDALARHAKLNGNMLSANEAESPEFAKLMEEAIKANADTAKADAEQAIQADKVESHWAAMGEKLGWKEQGKGIAKVMRHLFTTASEITGESIDKLAGMTPVTGDKAKFGNVSSSMIPKDVQAGQMTGDFKVGNSIYFKPTKNDKTAKKGQIQDDHGDGTYTVSYDGRTFSVKEDELMTPKSVDARRAFEAEFANLDEDAKAVAKEANRQFLHEMKKHPGLYDFRGEGTTTGTRQRIIDQNAVRSGLRETEKALGLPEFALDSALNRAKHLDALREWTKANPFEAPAEAVQDAAGEDSSFSGQVSDDVWGDAADFEASTKDYVPSSDWDDMEYTQLKDTQDAQYTATVDPQSDHGTREPIHVPGVDQDAQEPGESGRDAGGESTPQLGEGQQDIQAAFESLDAGVDSQLQADGIPAQGEQGNLADDQGSGRPGAEKQSSRASKPRRSRGADGKGAPAKPERSENALENAVPDQAGELEREADIIAESLSPAPSETAKTAESAQLSDEVKEVLAAVPRLLPEQAGDVVKAEARFKVGNGMMFTNGTGTGKTYTGGGVIKRFHDQGKKNILIIAPSQDIVAGWIKEVGTMGVPVNRLKSTKDAGADTVATTYANLGQNSALVGRRWDLIVFDESHKLLQAEKSDTTKALEAMRALSNEPKWHFLQPSIALADKIKRVKSLAESLDRNEAEDTELMDLKAEIDEKEKAMLADAKNHPTSKVLFLSATPFGYHKTIDYGNKFLFDYDEGKPSDNRSSGRYNQGDNQQQYMIANFGYRMKNNKLNKPEAEAMANLPILERAWHQKLVASGSLSGRKINVPFDYDRKFVTVDAGVGAKIDEAMDFMQQRDTTGKSVYGKLAEYVNKRFTYLDKMRLLESIRAKAAVGIIKEHHAMGRKVVVFHDYNEGGGFSPFDTSTFGQKKISAKTADMEGLTTEEKADLEEELAESEAETGDAELFYMMNREDIDEQAEALKKVRPDIFKIKFDDYQAPRHELKRHFPNAMQYNGNTKQEDRQKFRDRFNSDAHPEANLIIVQSAAGEAGISLHDTTGKSQRILLNLGMPVRPITAIQQEGRIYRVGQKSDAVFRYLTTGTNFEASTFANKIATRSGTAENLAMGDEARALQQSFIDSYNNASDFPASEEDGKGGKEADDARSAALSGFLKARALYFTNAKGRKNNLGKDFFATPEPLGFKMVEWANVKENERTLEPSAGAGAIARFFPTDTSRHMVESSPDLAPRAQMAVPGAKLHHMPFEDFNTVNKFNAIVMNPPFGQAGAAGIAHMAKAAKHLSNGGRMVVLLPTGITDEKFNKWNEGEEGKHFHTIAEIALPAATFERAGTKVMTKVRVIEKQTGDMDAKKLPEMRKIDLSRIESTQAFFDAIENLDLPPRVEPMNPDNSEFIHGDTVSIFGHDMKVQKEDAGIYHVWTRERTNWSDAQFMRARSSAERFGGRYTFHRDTHETKFGPFRTARQLASFITSLQTAMKEDSAASIQNQETVAKENMKAQGVENPAALAAPKAEGVIPFDERDYTTKAGKKLKGWIVKGYDAKTLKADVDKFAWNMDGGVFVRQEHEAALRELMARKPIARLNQQEKDPLGVFDILNTGETVIRMFRNADRSTFIHESGHFMFEFYGRLAMRFPDKPEVVKNWHALLDLAGIRHDIHLDEINAAAANPKHPEHDAIVAGLEKGTRSWEAYLMDGKAPVKELRSVFRRFMGWLTKTYRAFTSKRTMDIQISPEISQLFDRIIVGQRRLDEEQAITAAILPPAAINKMKMDGDDEIKMDAARQLTQQEAEDLMRAKLLAGLSRADNDERYKEVAADARAHARNEVEAMPIYQAMKALSHGDKLNNGELKRIYGPAVLDALPVTVPPIRSKNGTADADMVAQEHGFPDAQALVHALIKAEPFGKAVDRKTEELILVHYGDPLAENKNQSEVDAIAALANHQDRRGALLVLELNAIMKKIDANAPPPDISLKVAENTAKSMLEGMPVKEAGKWQNFRRAESKAGHAATKAILAGKWAEAAKFKRAQLAQYALGRESLRISEMTTARLSRMRRHGESKTIHRDHKQQIDNLLAAFRIAAKQANGVTLQQFLNDEAAQANAIGMGDIATVQIPADLLIADLSQVSPWKDCTDSEIADIDTAITALARTGRAKQKEESTEGRRVHDEKVAELTEELLRHATPAISQEQQAKDKDRLAVLRRLNSAFEATRTVRERMIQLGDKVNGAFAKHIFNGISDAQAFKYDMQEAAKKRMDARIAALPESHKKAMRTPVYIKSGEGTYWAWKTREELISAALNLGNEQNADKLMRGEADQGLTPEILEDALQNLTAEDWLFVDGTIQDLEIFWPQIAKMETEDKGAPPPKVKAQPRVVTCRNAAGEMVTLELKGGYYPIKYDKNRDATGKLAAFDAALVAKLTSSVTRRPATANGYTKTRTQAAYAFDLRLGIISEHIDEVTHNLAYRRPLLAAHKLIADPRFRAAYSQRFGEAAYEQLPHWLMDIASDKVKPSGVTGMENLMRYFRKSMTVMALGFKLSTTMIQVSGLATTMSRVGVRTVSASIARLSSQGVIFGDRYKEIIGMSGEMRHRHMVLDRDMRHAMEHGLSDTSAMKTLNKVQKWSFIPLREIDRVITTIAWDSGYSKATADGLSHEDAVRYADSVVTDQGSGATKDLAAIMRGNEFLRMFTMFVGPMNAIFNRLMATSDEFRVAMREGRAKDVVFALAWRLFLLVPLQAAIGELIVGRGPDEDKDEDEMAWLARKTILFSTSGIPFIRDVMSGAVEDRPERGSVVVQVGKATFEGGDAVADFFRDDPKPALENTADIMDAAGYALGLPIGQLTRMMRNIERQSGDEPFNINDLKPLITPIDYLRTIKN